MSHSQNVFRSWIILGYLFNLITVSTQESFSLHFLREPAQRFYLLRGRTNGLDCSYEDGGGAVSHFWYRNESPVDGQQVYTFGNGTLMFDVGDGSQEPNLYFEGFYRCCITNGTSTLCGTTSHVSYPTLGTPRVVTSQTTAILDETFRLVCSVHGDPSPNISWFKDGVAVAGDGDRLKILPNDVIQISQVDFSHRGHYVCSAENILSPTSSPPFELQVSPSSSSDPSLRGEILNTTSRQVVGTVGTDVFLECQVQDVNNVEVHWTKGTENIPEDRWETIGHGNLLLKNLTLNDTGIYVCTSSDRTANRVRNINVNVTVQAPPIFTRVPPASISRPEGIPVVFYCEVFGEPAPSVVWYRDGIRLPLGGRYSQTYSTSLWLHNLHVEDSGLYQCYASNPLGSIYTTAYLDVERSTAPPVENLRVNDVTSDTVTIIWTLSPFRRPFTSFVIRYTKLPDGDERDSLKTLLTVGRVWNHTLTKLQPNSNYSISVRAVYKTIGFSKEDTVYAVTLESAPSEAPRIMNLTTTSTTLTALWEPVDLDNMNGALNCTVICLEQQQAEDDCVRLPPPVTFYTFTNLRPGTEYLVRIAAATQIGRGPFSDSYPRITPIGVNCTTPDAVTVMSRVVNSSFVLFTWSPRRGVQRDLIRGYRLIIDRVTLAYGSTRVDFVLLDADATSYNKSNAVQQSTYSIMFYAIGDCGEGPASTDVIQMPEEVYIELVDVVPHNVESVALSADMIQIRWDPPVTKDQVISYTIEYGVIGGLSQTQISHSTEAIILGLQTYTFYQFKVIANFARRTAASALEYCRTAEGAPASSPVNLRAVAIDSKSLNVSWDKPEMPNGVIVNYTVFYMNTKRLSEGWKNKTKIVREGEKKWILLRNLEPETRYSIRVAASTLPGRGPLSPPIDSYTHHTGSGEFSSQVTDIRKGILIGIGLAILCIIVCAGLLFYHNRASCCYHSTSHPHVVAQQAGIPLHKGEPHRHRRGEGYPLRRSKHYRWSIAEREMECLMMRDLRHSADGTIVQPHYVGTDVPARGLQHSTRGSLHEDNPGHYTSQQIPHTRPTDLQGPSWTEQDQGDFTPAREIPHTQPTDLQGPAWTEQDPTDCSPAGPSHMDSGDSTPRMAHSHGGETRHSGQGPPPNPFVNVQVICHKTKPKNKETVYSRDDTSRPATSAPVNSDTKAEGLGPSDCQYQGPHACCRSPYKVRGHSCACKSCLAGDDPITREGVSSDDVASSASSLDRDSGLNGDFTDHTHGGCDTSEDFIEKVLAALSV